MKITTPQSWRELTEWQLAEIADLYLNAAPADFSTASQTIILILLQSEPSSAERTKLYRILGKVSVEALAEHADFLMNTTNLHFFPEVDGLTKPADRLASIIVKHFAVDDKFLHG